MSTEAPVQAGSTMTPEGQFRRDISAMSGKFQDALPRHVPVEKFIRVATSYVLMAWDKLGDCDRRSLWGALMTCAMDGLMPDGQEAGLTPFKGVVKYIPMVKGILKKIRNSGELKSILAMVVNKKDDFKFFVDENGEHLLHTPTREEDPGEITDVYVVAQTKDGGRYVERMTRAQIEKVRQCSRAKDGGPWKEWYDEMAKKTVIRRISKRLPMSTDLEDVIRRDDELYDLEPKPAVETQKSPSKLSEAIGVVAAAVPSTTADATSLADSVTNALVKPARVETPI